MVSFKAEPGIGTISNAILIALSIDIFVNIIPKNSSLLICYFEMIIGIFLVAIGSGIYLITNLGPGTRNGLMKGISENYKKPIAHVRLLIETSVVFLGWSFGGTVSIGTILFAFLIGPLISFCLTVIEKINRK